jgi:hypothetical protein
MGRTAQLWIRRDKKGGRAGKCRQRSTRHFAGQHLAGIDIHEDDLDEAQMATWVKQAAALPGWVP